jgi:hypothetical protein
MDIALEIEGVSDRGIVNAIRKRVRGLRRHMSTPGEWRATIAPLETRGEWDLGIHAPSGWHLASFMEPSTDCPTPLSEYYGSASCRRAVSP